jgi:cell division protein FtsL
MARVNLALLVVLVLTALGVVSAQHKARKLFSELEREQQKSHQLDVEWGQLQLEQSTWASHGRVEKIARARLAMNMPTSDRLVLAPPAVTGERAP